MKRQVSDWPLFWLLDKLALSIKQGFKFLNTLGLSCENKTMFSIRQTHQVDRPIIFHNPIEMVNYPTFRKWFAVGFLPNEKMFTDISVDVCVFMVRAIYIDIPISSNAPFSLSFNNRTRFPSEFLSANFTPCSLPANEYSTIQTWVPMFFRKFFHVIKMICSPLIIISKSFFTVLAIPSPLLLFNFLFVSFSIFFCSTHITIITLFWKFINEETNC